MTTPRVYSINKAMADLLIDAEFILLSDHKEVVGKLEAQLEKCKNQRDSYAMMVTPAVERNSLWVSLNAELAKITPSNKPFNDGDL